MTTPELAIRPAAYLDQAAVWTTLEPAIRAGETLALDRDLTRAGALDYWFSARGDQLRQCGLTSASGPDQRQALTMRELERNVRQNR